LGQHCDEGYDPPVTPVQAAELERRLEEDRTNPGSAIPWAQVKADLDKKFGKAS
jgi:putative addiction module component (TIGR02574 family)